MEKLIIIDGNSLINRAYYALPPLLTKDGHIYNAVFGFTNIIIKLLCEHKPTHMVVAFDAGKKTFRNELFSDYKGTRKSMPEELRCQLEPLKSLLKQMGIKTIEKLGIEADDIIGTISKNINYKTVILTGDRDCLQLIDDNCEVWLTKHGISEILSVNTRQLKEEFGLTPKQVIDLKALMGDQSDNIPGVAGIGEKTAKNLLEKYETAQNVYAHIDEISGKLKEKLIAGESDCKLSYVLATIKTDCDLDFCLDDFAISLPFSNEVYKTFQMYEFSSLIKRQDLFSSEVLKNDEILKQKQTNIKTVDQIFDKLKNNTVAILELDNMVEFAINENEYYVLEDGLCSATKILEDESITKIFHKLKPVLLKNEVFGLCHDLSLMTYLLNSNIKVDSLTEILSYFNVAGAQTACSLFKAFCLAKQKLKEFEMEKLYHEVELPLVYVLKDMEQTGICVDKEFLKELNIKFLKEIEVVTKQIYELAGEEFNINSPKQLGVILFEKLGLQTKNNKKLSTSVEILEQLKKEHPIIDLILKYRTYAKLNSTYVEAMQNFIQDGKIHTTFNQTNTTTGRLSSNDPNLQNIPIRTKEGKILRKMFVASKDCVLLSADYSQIELRLLAHYSGDENLINAYAEGKDIHKTTASQIFNVPYDDVTEEMRYMAKAVNFGIIYGISPYGLSNNTGVSSAEAKSFIEKYFQMYPTIKTFLNSSVEKAKQNGFVTTLLGRRRNITEIYSTNHNTQMFGERAAMNMPLQGTASDIIKLAMLKVFDELKKQNLKSKLILQIHDELILDVLEEEKHKVIKIVKQSMENVMKLKVPLVADISVGKNLFDTSEIPKDYF